MSEPNTGRRKQLRNVRRDVESCGKPEITSSSCEETLGLFSVFIAEASGWKSSAGERRSRLLPSIGPDHRTDPWVSVEGWRTLMTCFVFVLRFRWWDYQTIVVWDGNRSDQTSCDRRLLMFPAVISLMFLIGNLSNKNQQMWIKTSQNHVDSS